MRTRGQERAAAAARMPRLFAHSPGVTAWVREELERRRELHWDAHDNGGRNFRVRVRADTTRVAVFRLQFPSSAGSSAASDSESARAMFDATDVEAHEAEDAEDDEDACDKAEAEDEEDEEDEGADETRYEDEPTETFLFDIDADEVWLGQFQFGDHEIATVSTRSETARKRAREIRDAASRCTGKTLGTVQAVELAEVDARADAALAASLRATGRAPTDLLFALGSAVALVSKPQPRFKLARGDGVSKQWSGLEFDRTLTVVGPSILELSLGAEQPDEGFEAERVLEFVSFVGGSDVVGAYIRTNTRYIFPDALNYCSPTLQLTVNEAAPMHVVDLLGIPYHAVDGCKTRVPRPWDGDGDADADEAESKH
jgi:hypothetical protein